MSSSVDILGSGSAYYANMSAADYAQRINTPAGIPDYYEQFHAPVLDHARAHSDGQPITVLDIACGPGFELDFFREDPDVRIIATDISPDILPSVKKRLGEEALVFAADSSYSALRPEVADAGMVVNAMVYVPADMLRSMFDALKPGGRCAVNFRVHGNDHNRAFYDHYTERGGLVIPGTMRDDQGTDKAFDMMNLDYRQCMTDDALPDEKIRKLGIQTYFTSSADIEEIVAGIGFNAVEHGLFNFASPVNPDNQIDVLVLEKPA